MGEVQLLHIMCSGSEAGSYVRLIDFVYHSTLGLRVIKRKRRRYVAPTALVKFTDKSAFQFSNNTC